MVRCSACQGSHSSATSLCHSSQQPAGQEAEATSFQLVLTMYLKALRCLARGRSGNDSLIPLFELSIY